MFLFESKVCSWDLNGWSKKDVIKDGRDNDFNVIDIKGIGFLFLRFNVKVDIIFIIKFFLIIF